MSCQQCQELFDDLLIVGRDELDRPEIAEHVASCLDCARQRERSLAALEAITWSASVSASAELKQRLVDLFPETDARPMPANQGGSPAARVWRAAMIFAAAAMVMLAIGVFRGKDDGPSAFSLIAEATAAEARFFAAGQLVHLVNEIIVRPVADAELSQARWLPLVSIDANGQQQIHQLNLAAEPGKGYTVRDRSWHDSQTGRFARVLSVEDRLLFANAFDGQAVYTLVTDAQGKQRIERTAIGKDFRSPGSPAAFLGLAAGLTSSLEQKADLVTDAGKTTLADGAEARVVKLSYSQQGAPKQVEAFFRIAIRNDNHTIDSVEFVVQGQSLFLMQRGTPGPISEPDVGWDLAKLSIPADQPAAPLGAGVLANLVVPNVSVEDMAARADFPVYVLARDPAWTGKPQIMDVLDIVSPPHRMFATIYRASNDHRHVVLLQSHSFNEKLGAQVAAGKLIYTSPSGVEVYSNPNGQWMASILLQSSRSVLLDPPADNRTAYLLKTPEGTIPSLAINGPLSDEELHALVDSLTPAKK